jgi:hypothetical protein
MRLDSILDNYDQNKWWQFFSKGGRNRMWVLNLFAEGSETVVRVIS